MESADSTKTEAVIHRFIDRFNAGDREGFAATLSDEFTFTALGHTYEAEQFVDVEFSYHDGFSDLAYTLDDLSTSGFLAGFRWTLSGTHDTAGGPGPLADAEPTGKRIEVTGLNVAIVQDGRIVELWGEYDGLGMYNQLGFVTVEETYATE